MKGLKMTIKLKDWAALNGISYKTALKRFKDGTIDGQTYESDTGRYFVKVESMNDQKKEIIKNIVTSIELLEGAKKELERK